MDWQTRNVLPMIAHWRKSVRVVARVGFLHGVARSRSGKLSSNGRCRDTVRTNLAPPLTVQP